MTELKFIPEKRQYELKRDHPPSTLLSPSDLRIIGEYYDKECLKEDINAYLQEAEKIFTDEDVSNIANIYEKIQDCNIDYNSSIADAVWRYYHSDK